MIVNPDIQTSQVAMIGLGHDLEHKERLLVYFIWNIQSIINQSFDVLNLTKKMEFENLGYGKIYRGEYIAGENIHGNTYWRNVLGVLVSGDYFRQIVECPFFSKARILQVRSRESCAGERRNPRQGRNSRQERAKPRF